MQIPSINNLLHSFSSLLLHLSFALRNNPKKSFSILFVLSIGHALFTPVPGNATSKDDMRKLKMHDRKMAAVVGRHK